ncbi:MAG: hypothetical protein ACRDGV_08370 [Candidatus Limnocylindria bacterium]
MSLTRSLAVILASAVLLLGATPALARKPEPTPALPAERPLTAEELALGEQKIQAAERHLATVDASDQMLSISSCPTPTGDGTQATTQSCSVPAGFLSVNARDQERGHYCGPAVGQVVANYSWAMAANANKFSQRQIAIWMKTDVNGQTSSPELAAGLNTATHASPREPAGWNWVVINLRDRNGNGLVGDELHGYVRSNVSVSKMPLAIPVKPHQPGAQFHLVSWPRAISSPGHWIATYGWYGNYNGTDFARIYYTDSSRDEGGSTGKFWDPTRHIAILIMAHTQRLVW